MGRALFLLRHSSSQKTMPSPPSVVCGLKLNVSPPLLCIFSWRRCTKKHDIFCRNRITMVLKISNASFMIEKIDLAEIFKVFKFLLWLRRNHFYAAQTLDKSFLRGISARGNHFHVVPIYTSPKFAMKTLLLHRWLSLRIIIPRWRSLRRNPFRVDSVI